MEDLVVANALSTCEGITVANGYHVTVKKVSEDWLDLDDIHASNVPLVMLDSFLTRPAPDPGIGRREVNGTLVLRIALKQKNAHRYIRRAGRDVEDIMLVDRDRGQDGVVTTKWISTRPYIFKSEGFAWANVTFEIFWSEVRT
jgi:hypothetical protein